MGGYILQRIGIAIPMLVAISLILSGLAARPQSADVALVFGNTVERTGEPSPRLRARLETARELYASRQVRWIIVSGGFGREGFNESAVMKGYLVRHGVPANVIHADPHGLNTTRSCVNARAASSSPR